MNTTATATIAPMPAADYHADSTAVGSSGLKLFRQRRLSYYREYVLGQKAPEKTAKHMDLGTLVHSALLEPHRLRADFAEYPEYALATNGAASTKAAKAFKEDNEAAGRIVLKAADFATAAAMVESVRKTIGPWLDVPAKIEHAIYWTDAASGIRCKCRPDFLILKNGQSFVLDVKTTADVSPAEFQRRAEQMYYWMQDVHYSAGVKALTGNEPMFLFVAVESEWPYQSAVYQIDETNIATAEMIYRETLAELAECHRSGKWHDSWEGIINPLTLKPWAFN